MLSAFAEDFNILYDYFKKHIKLLIKRINYSTNYIKEKTIYSSNYNKSSTIKTLIELHGAKKLGGELLGKKHIENIPVYLYKIKRGNSSDVVSYFYAAYIIRKNDKYQFVLTDNFDKLIEIIPVSINTNKKVEIKLKSSSVKGVNFNAKKRGRYGRRTL